MSKDQKGFIVFGDNEPIFNKLTDEEAGQLLKGMVKYFNYGIEPDFNDKLDMAWVTVKLQMDRNAEKYEKRCEKNRENVKKRYERIRSNTNEYDGIQSNTNATNRDKDRDRDRKRDRDKDKESVPDASSLSSFLIDHLNEKTGSNYTTSEAVIRQIDSLLASGYTENQMRTVIDKKCAEWMGDEKMRGYLRPSTLFGEKFGEYLAAPVSIALERETNRKRSELSRQLEEKRQALSVLNEALPDAEPAERRALREQIAILEDSIGVIERRLA